MPAGAAQQSTATDTAAQSSCIRESLSRPQALDQKGDQHTFESVEIDDAGKRHGIDARRQLDLTGQEQGVLEP